MDLSAKDIELKEFHDQWRGYNMNEVDDFLEKIADSLGELERENAALRTRIRELDEQVELSRGTEEMLKKTLVSAQKAADEAISEAKAKAAELITDAEGRAQRAREELRQRVATAEEEVRKRTAEAERVQAERTGQLEANIARLQALEHDLTQRMSAFLDRQRRALDDIVGASAPAPVNAEEPAEETETPMEPEALDLGSSSLGGPAADDRGPELEPQPQTETVAIDEEQPEEPLESAPLVLEPTGEFAYVPDDQAVVDQFRPYDDDPVAANGRRKRRGLFRRDSHDDDPADWPES